MVFDSLFAQIFNVIPCLVDACANFVLLFARMFDFCSLSSVSRACVTVARALSFCSRCLNAVTSRCELVCFVAVTGCRRRLVAVQIWQHSGFVDSVRCLFRVSAPGDLQVCNALAVESTLLQLARASVGFFAFLG